MNRPSNFFTGKYVLTLIAITALATNNAAATPIRHFATLYNADTVLCKQMGPIAAAMFKSKSHDQDYFTPLKSKFKSIGYKFLAGTPGIGVEATQRINLTHPSNYFVHIVDLCNYCGEDRELDYTSWSIDQSSSNDLSDHEQSLASSDDLRFTDIDLSEKNKNVTAEGRKAIAHSEDKNSFFDLYLPFSRFLTGKDGKTVLMSHRIDYFRRGNIEIFSLTDDLKIKPSCIYSNWY